MDTSQDLEFVSISFRNIYDAFHVAKRIFPTESLSLGISYVYMQMPRALFPLLGKVFSLPVLRRIGSSARIDQMEYFTAKEKRTGKIVGVTGLYSLKEAKGIWLGWYGVDPNSRGKGYGSQILEWTIQAARMRGHDTLWLWTSTIPESTIANNLYETKGFDIQFIDVAIPGMPGYQILLRGLGLNGQSMEPYRGSIKEAVAGLSDEDIKKGMELFEQNNAEYKKLQREWQDARRNARHSHHPEHVPQAMQ